MLTCKSRFRLRICFSNLQNFITVIIFFIYKNINCNIAIRELRLSMWTTHIFNIVISLGYYKPEILSYLFNVLHFTPDFFYYHILISSNPALSFRIPNFGLVYFLCTKCHPNP